jgi:uncharacterized membrane protein YbhN (UPF0104 family)
MGLGLFGHVLWSNRGSLREVFGHRPDLQYVVLAYLFFQSAVVTSFVRWYVVVRSQGLPLRLRDAVKIGFIANAVDLIVPMQVGGDVLKAAYLCRGQLNKTRAIAAIMIDRVIGVLGLLLLASLMGGMNWPASGPAVRRLIQLVWLASAGGLAGLSTIFFPTLLRPFERFAARHERIGTILAELRAMSLAYRDRRAGIALGVVMAMAGHALLSLSFFGVSRALLPHPPSMVQHLQMVPLVSLTMLVPLPFGALGLGEQVSDELFRMIGHPMGGLAMMGFRLISLAVGAVSISVYLANAHEFRSREPEVLLELVEKT